MIVSVSSSIVDVHIDDEIAEYNPSRATELARLVVQLYRDAVAGSVITVEVDEDAE